ncbi:MAG TPA: MBL fold metallo-hydrolase [Steroidobacteraceae bacterium]|nr:MBL fold metallo-hydrolase [Steroidobacteraceae bacterium]
MTFDRRSLLRGTVAGLMGVALAPLARTADSAPQARTRRLTEKIAVVSGVKDNVVALATDDGLLLVDSGSPGDGAALMRALRTLRGGGRVRTLINTHYHADQTGSNAAFGKAGATLIAQAKTRAWIATDHYDPEEDRYVKAMPKAAWPTQVFYSTGALTAGGEHIDYGHLLAAHTQGDCYVYFRDANVLAVGHVASPAADPAFDWFAGGWLGGRLDALALLYKLADEKTQIVPAFGPVVTRSELKAEQDLLQTVYTRMVDLLRKGYSAQDMLDAGVLNGLPRTFNDPKKFVYDAFKGLWGFQDSLAPNIV